MRKHTAGLLVIILIIAVCCASFLVGCNSTRIIDKYREKFLEADSVKISITMEVPGYVDVLYTTFIDGDKTYMPANMDGPAVYTELDGAVLNTYTNRGSYWEKTSEQITESEQDVKDDELIGLLTGENYEYSSEEKVFKLKSNVILRYEGMSFESLKLTIDGDSCTILGQVNISGVLVDCGISISDINNVELVFEEIVTGQIVSN